MKTLNITLLATIFFFSNIKAQDLNIIDLPIDEITNFLDAPIDDAKNLMEGYMEPLGKWFGSGLNAGWYNTGKPHRFPGFDITGGVHFISPDNNAMRFLPLLNSGLLSVDSENGELSTIIGSGESTNILLSNTDDVLLQSPGGLDKEILPMPYIQGSIGLIKKTELLFRYAPKVDYAGLSAGFWGFGIKHDLKQWIPVVKILPFNLSFLGAYSNLKSSFDFNEDNNLNFNVQAFNCNMILSKKIAMLTPYVGVGYQHSTSILSLTGDYKIYNTELQSILEENPVDLSFGGINGFKTNIGARLKFLLFTLHVDWTMAEYNILTIGIGLNSDIGSRIIGGGLERVTKKNREKEE